MACVTVHLKFVGDDVIVIDVIVVDSLVAKNFRSCWRIYIGSRIPPEAFALGCRCRCVVVFFVKLDFVVVVVAIVVDVGDDEVA